MFLLHCVKNLDIFIFIFIIDIMFVSLFLLLKSSSHDHCANDIIVEVNILLCSQENNGQVFVIFSCIYHISP